MKVFPGGSNSKEFACTAGDEGLIPGWGRSLGEENGNPLQYSCLKNPMDRGAWRVTVYSVTKSWTWRKVMTNLDSIFKSKGLSSQGYGFSSGHVWIVRVGL